MNTQFADFFPELDYHTTHDPRVFQTNFKKINKQGDKMKKYFCCILGADCYGVEVIRPSAGNAAKACDQAFADVIFAADYYEKNGTWPINA